MRSDNVTKGSERAPNRSLFYALGYTPEELERPLIGVVSAHSEIVPGHMNLDKIAEAVKAGVQMAGGTPILIPAIGVCDGIAMGHVGMKYSLASRELICDSVETMLMAHQLDGLVLVPNCDKIVPGMVMAAVRMDVPAVVCSGGPMLAGSYGGEEVSLSKMFEAVGAYKAGMITDEQLEDCTCNCCPSCGSCSGMYTANSMNCLCEAIAYTDGGNQDGGTTGHLHTGLDGLGDLIQIHVSGHDLAVGAHHADEGALQLLRGVAQRIKQAAVGRALRALGHVVTSHFSTSFLLKPSPSRLRRATSPERERFSRRSYKVPVFNKSSPFRGSCRQRAA